MGVDSTSQLAGVINNLVKGQQAIEESYADDGLGEFLLAPFESIAVGGTVTVYGKTYDEEAFILDHPVQGELDSSTLALDGGYDGSPVELYTTNF